MKRKILAVIIAALTLLSAASCGTSSGEVYEIGICTLSDHSSLSAAAKGFKAVLSEKLGSKVKFTEKNADGDAEKCITICNEFVSSKVDLILANATDSLKAAADATEEIPIIGTSVTDYSSVLGIDSTSTVTGRNISGTSDVIPVTEQASMVAELFPSATHHKLGFLYCSDEANSAYQAEILTPMFEALGYSVTPYTFKNPDEIGTVVKTACENSSVLFIPADNTAATHAETINSAASALKIPIITSDEGTCAVCGVATLGIDYTELGRKAGLQAYRVLTEGADIAKIEIEYADKAIKKYNPEKAKTLGLTVPEGYVAIDISDK